MNRKMNDIAQNQKDWKEFEKCLIPIMEKCELCQEFAICGFHEKWYSLVKIKFFKFIRRNDEKP
jgi:hypothetical protein